MMELVGTTINLMSYIQSEAEFNRAKNKGSWQRIFYRMTGRRPTLRCFEQALETVQSYCTVEIGLQDIAIQQIIGSVGRSKNFTPDFLPATSSKNSQERWRTIYTLAVTGAGFPAIEVYKIGLDYFVKDGHHRVSVARYLGWLTMQANVIEVLASDVAVGCHLGLGNGVKLCG